MKALLVLVLIPLALAEWKLSWSDEFNKPYIDNVNWGWETGFVRNNEDQFYTYNRTKNARTSNGYLIIEAHRERYYAGNTSADYTSASLSSLRIQEFQYGKFEIRAKIPTLLGSWPAWWMLGRNFEWQGWPICGEMDILEYYRWCSAHPQPTSHLAANLIDSWGNFSGAHTEVQPSFGDDFHIWTMEWDYDAIVMSLDGVIKVKYPVSRANWNSTYNPFRQPRFMIVNLAIGGNCGGDPSNTTFPLQYLVDYIRVYKWVFLRGFIVYKL